MRIFRLRSTPTSSCVVIFLFENNPKKCVLLAALLSPLTIMFKRNMKILYYIYIYMYVGLGLRYVVLCWTHISLCVNMLHSKSHLKESTLYKVYKLSHAYIYIYIWDNCDKMHLISINKGKEYSATSKLHFFGNDYCYTKLSPHLHTYRFIARYALCILSRNTRIKNIYMFLNKYRLGKSHIYRQ